MNIACSPPLRRRNSQDRGSPEGPWIGDGEKGGSGKTSHDREERTHEH